MKRLKHPGWILASLLAAGGISAGHAGAAGAAGELGSSGDVRAAYERARREAPGTPAEQMRLDAIRDVYSARNFAPLWFSKGDPTEQSISLQHTLQDAEEYGLRPGDYVAQLEMVRAPGSEASANGGDAADFDLALSRAALRFLADLHFGRVDPRVAGFELGIRRPPLDLRALLEELATLPDIDPVIASVEPQFHHYQLLKQALERYRLLASGAATATPAERATGPYERRIRQIELTLERWRWLPAFDTPPIIVNIPQFRLFALHSTRDRKAEILQMDVIVGRTYPRLRTPVFTADMKYVVFRPYWDVPYSITQREMLPEIRSKPDYLQKQHMEIVRGESDSAPVLPVSPESIRELAEGKARLRQQPGEDNALGLIKFMLPNPHNVYLHSTPARSLFGRSRRAFSHGCIRVSDPVALASYVLRNAPGEWTPESIVAAMHGADAFRVNLTKPIRVLVLYGTALATEDGGISFFDDIYGHDRKLERLLKLPPVTAR